MVVVRGADGLARRWRAWSGAGYPNSLSCLVVKSPLLLIARYSAAYSRAALSASARVCVARWCRASMRLSAAMACCCSCLTAASMRLFGLGGSVMAADGSGLSRGVGWDAHAVRVLCTPDGVQGAPPRSWRSGPRALRLGAVRTRWRSHSHRLLVEVLFAGHSFV